MATQTDSGFPTLVNIVKMMEPNGGIVTNFANTLTKKLPLLQDMPWKAGNLLTGNRVTSVLGLPSPTWRKVNSGLDPTVADTVQYDETCGMLEDYSKIDVALADVSGNAPQFRANQDRIKKEAFSQEIERAVFYESASTHPERIHGLAARYAFSSGSTTSAYVMKQGTISGTNAESIWLINWDPDLLCGIYPMGTKAGLEIEDLGRQLVPDSNNKQFLAYVTHLVWRAGINVEDYRYAVRMQWDPDDTTTYPDTGKQFYTDVQAMIATVFDLQPSARFYMSRTSFKKLQAQLATNNLNYLQFVNEASFGGITVAVPKFLGVPIRITDTLTGESPVT